MIKVAKMLAYLFDAHKADFIASGKFSHHHYKTLCSAVAASDPLAETTIANEIISNDIRAIFKDVLLKF